MHKFNVSIIIAVYNVEKYLWKCIESIMSQLDPFDEVILVDDGSKDSSFSICQKAQATYKNITLIHTKNHGCSAARNTGFELAQGEYVIFMDSDDYWLENSYQQIKSEIMKHKDCGAFLIDYKKLDDQTGEIIEMDLERTYQADQALLGKDFVLKLLKVNKHLNVAAWRFIVKKEALIKHQIRFEEGLYFEDMKWAFQVLLNVESAQYLPYSLNVYRTNTSHQITGSLSLKKILDRIKISAYWFNEAPQYFQDKEDLNLFIRRTSELYFTSVVSFRGLNNTQEEKIILEELNKHKVLLNYPNHKRYEWVANTSQRLGIGVASRMFYRLNQLKHKMK